MMKLLIVLGLASVIYGLPSRWVKNTPDNLVRLANLRNDDHAEELSGQFEGDIVLSDAQERALRARTGLVNENYRWPGAKVPYEIVEADFSPAQVKHIIEGLHSIEAVTCIRFEPYDPLLHTDYVRVFGTDSGCWSQVGRQGRMQELHLEPSAPESGCFRLATVTHEFIHALGFYHQQSATERDEYVQIVLENIEAGKEHNFNTYPATTINNQGIEYDYNSVMHYGATAFSKNGLRTIIPIKDPEAPIGQRIGMSAKDIARLNIMYNCNV